MGTLVCIGTYGLEALCDGDFRGVVEIVRQADEAGVDMVSITEHVVMGERTDRYPYGDFPTTPDTPWPDPLIMLAAIAAVTKRIRLSTAVLIAPLRSAPLLAKSTATLDLLSGGRLDLGVGSGWQREEFEASGMLYEGRGAHMENMLRACQALWRHSPASFSSPTVSFQHIHCRPAPLQKDGIPLWFGLAPTDSNCRRIAQLGIGWLPINPDPAYLEEGIGRLRAAFKKEKRDAATLRVRTHLPLKMGAAGRPDLEQTLAGAAAAVRSGATDIELLPALFLSTPQECGAFFRRLLQLRA